MHSTRYLFLAAALLVLISGVGVFARPSNIPGSDLRNGALDDVVPEVTARVARISELRGDATVRRGETGEWEKAVNNLPLVEGDEIVTSADGRIELQFGPTTHLRLAENSVLKLTILKDGGIGVSLPQGSVGLTVDNFDKDRSYFEIDAPQTTAAVQRSGTYRVDAGQQGDTEVRIAVTKGGEVRVYSDNSGFTLRSGRAAKLAIAGSYAGEWQTFEAERFSDEFDAWTIERDAAIAKLLRDAYYDKYYDRDMYGAEDLNAFGEWVYTRDYGYVWRPNTNATASYSDWTPYRYGQWRFIPPYGWTWIGDEPWGWATYHYGRWIWDNTYWVWSPYGYYRNSRSWWQPALVIIQNVGSDIAWYPLPYRQRSRHYGCRDRHERGQRNGQDSPSTGTTTPTPLPPAQTSTPIFTAEQRRRRSTTPPLQNMPPTAVVLVPASDFGRGRGSFRLPPLSTARRVFAVSSDENQTPPLLPPPTKIERGADKPTVAFRTDTGTRVGAADRRSDSPLDGELQKRRIFGDRTPVQPPPRGRADQPRPQGDAPRKTGAVERPPIFRQDPEPARVKESPRETRRSEPANRDESPPFVPPITKPEPRYESPKKQDAPRYDPPDPKSDAPRSDPPKSDAPTKNEMPSEKKGKG